MTVENEYNTTIPQNQTMNKWLLSQYMEVILILLHQKKGICPNKWPIYHPKLDAKILKAENSKIPAKHKKRMQQMIYCLTRKIFHNQHIIFHPK